MAELAATCERYLLLKLTFRNSLEIMAYSTEFEAREMHKISIDVMKNRGSYILSRNDSLVRVLYTKIPIDNKCKS